MKIHRYRKIVLRNILLALVVGLLLASARSGDLFHSLRLGSTDFLHGDTDSADEIIIVAIDDASIAQYGSWPWPHSLHTQLIKKLGQARAVGLDILFDEVNDRSLIDAVAQSNNVILAQVAILPERVTPGIITSQTLLSPPPDLQTSALGTGIVSISPDSDGVIRRVPLFVQYRGKNKEALSLQLLRQYLTLTDTASVGLSAGYVSIGLLQIPVDSWGRMVIHFAGPPGTFSYVSAADVLSGVVSPAAFKDKIILYGQMNLTGGGDVHAVPTSRGKEKISGVEIQANIIHTLLRQHFLIEQSLIKDIATILVMSLLGGAILFRLRFWWGIPSILLVGGCFLLYAAALFDRGVLPDLFYPSLSLGLSYIAAIAIDNVSLFRSLKLKHAELTQTYDATLQSWARALELRDYETKGHTIRVTDMTVELARLMGVNEEDLVHIGRGATLHDIGKICIPDGILLKPDKLTKEEWEIMRQHTNYGYEMILPIRFLEPALDIIICHHEKWDGSGYPNGLKGEEIPLSARIFSVVDVWDALTFDRPYRQAVSKEKVIAMIQDDSGTHFDPQVVDVFIKYIKKKL